MVPSSSKLQWTVQSSWKKKDETWRVTGRVKANPKSALRNAVLWSELLRNPSGVSKSHHSKLPCYISNIQLLIQTGKKLRDHFSLSHPLHLSFQMGLEQLWVPGWAPITTAFSQGINSRLIDIRGISFKILCSKSSKMKAQYVSVGTAEYFLSFLALEDSVEGLGRVAPFDLSLLLPWTVQALGSVQNWGEKSHQKPKPENQTAFFPSLLL